MTEAPAAAALDYAPWQYSGSRLTFRGPPRLPEGRYVAALGSGETFGRFVAAPWPAMVEARLGCPVLNLGQANGGVDAFLNDGPALQLAAGARAVALQVLGAHKLSNRFYTVHARRNDRFVRTTPTMRAVFPEVDFTEFHFTRHMLGALERRSPERFALIRDEIRRVWVARMNLLMSKIDRKTVLVWVGTRRPDDPAESWGDGDPPYVTRAMIDALRGRVVDLVEVVLPDRDAPEGMVFGPGEDEAALRMPGPETHAEIAAEVAARFRRIGVMK